MKISVVTFARIKEVMGADRVELQVDSDATVADLKSLLLTQYPDCLLYTSPSPRDLSTSRMPSSA